MKTIIFTYIILAVSVHARYTTLTLKGMDNHVYETDVCKGIYHVNDTAMYEFKTKAEATEFVRELDVIK